MNNRYKLLKLLNENPDKELKFFVSDDCGYDYFWNECSISDIVIKKLALYNDEMWLDVEDYEEMLYDDLCDDYENDERLESEVDKEMGKVEFKEYICVYLI